MVELVIKGIVFQIGLLINFFSFPFWLTNFAFKLVRIPLNDVIRAKDQFFDKLCRVCDVVLANVSPSIHRKLRDSHLFRKYAKKMFWGCIWAMYVCFMLFCVLVLGFIVGGITVNCFVEEPVQIKEVLNFDYTKANPVALVPITTCDGVEIGVVVGRQKIEARKRVIPPNHHLEVTVSLTLPESDHNRNLGVFQVKVEFLTVNGKVLSASSKPCMLHYKSSPIRYAETFLRSGPLLVGYTSESQILNVKMAGFTEGLEPTACLKVILEQRAEFKPGVGIPEIYAASLVLESELPLIKRFFWNWRKTIFIWTSMSFFVLGLFFMLVCCKPVILPRPKQTSASGNTT